MASKFRLFTKGFLIYCNIGAAILFLLSCLVPALHPQKWWVISFLGLAFPILLVILLVFIIGWLIVLQPRITVISLIALLAGQKSIGVFFAFHKPRTFEYKKEAGNIRIASWNVARFLELKINNNANSQKRLKMLELLRQQDADILCLQEFHTSTNPEYYDNITPIRKELGYPYYYFSFDTDGDNLFYSSIIFSRFPIVDSGLIRYPRPTLPDALIHADIKVGQDTIRVYTTHLQSLQFGKTDYERLQKIRSGEDSLVSHSRTILSKIKKGMTYRAIQAAVISEVIEDSPHPVILGADLNDVPNSYTYFTVRGRMQDAFLKRGFGIGRTFSSLSPTLRIDYIFADNNFKVSQFGRVMKRYSDHYMILADLVLKKPETQ